MAAVRSFLKSAAAGAPSPFRISCQKSLCARIFRAPVEMSNVAAASFSTGSKRFQRIQRGKIDLKRSSPSMGIVEGVEYDANRTSRIALVRWEGGSRQRNRSAVEEFVPPLESTTTTTVRGPFAFSSVLDGSKKANILHSVFSSKAKGEASSFTVPRIAVAGARPAFFVVGKKEREMGGENTFSFGEIRHWRPDSILWTHRNKRKAAVSWQTLKGQEGLGLARASERKRSKTKKDPAFYSRAPLSYILASHQMKPGMTVVNWSKPPKSNLSRWNTNAF